MSNYNPNLNPNTAAGASEATSLFAGACNCVPATGQVTVAGASGAWGIIIVELIEKPKVAPAVPVTDRASTSAFLP